MLGPCARTRGRSKLWSRSRCAAPEARRVALEGAGYNTFLLRSDDVFIDLLTDSGTSALSQEQRAAMELGDESYAGSRSYYRLEAAMREVYGYRHLIPTHQGRGAEHLLARLLVQPGQVVPSNLYFTTSRAHVELAGGIWVDVAVPEATDPGAQTPFKGNIDLHALEHVLSAAQGNGVAYVRQEACVNMAGGQPFSVDNLAEVHRLAHMHGMILILDATRISENAVFVKDREPGWAGWPLPKVIRTIANLSDGAIFSSKKDHFVPIGGFLAVNDDELAERAREQVVVYEGFPHYGGIAGHDMEALAQGIRESTDEATVRHYVSQAAYLGGLLGGGRRADRRAGRRARRLRGRKAVRAPNPAQEVPRTGARRGDLPRRRRADDGARDRLGPARRRAVRRARAGAPHPAAPGVHAGAPRVRGRGRDTRV